ncbi:MAG: hypothetical protein HY914_14460 [Desulfomonile tiedjei]|nr:hypothetical protein [Desulfomonile tiedjei]
MRAVILIVVLLLLAGVALAGGDREVRDANGRLIGTWHDRPNGIAEFRDANGALRIDRTRRGSDAVYRDKNGRTIGTERDR